MRGISLEMTSNQVKKGLKWGNLAPRLAGTGEKRTFTSAADLRTLGISAAC